MKLRILTATEDQHVSNDSGNGSTEGTDQLQPPQFDVIITFLVISSIIASLIEGFFPRKILRFLPQPVILMIIYIIAGAIAGQPFAVEIDAEIILTIFLPALLTNEALKIKTTPFYKSLVGLIWLIGPALFLGAAIVAVYPYAFFPENDRFNWNLSMAMGGMIATTDPIAVMMFLSEVMTPRRLSAMVSGESLLNDATSIICVVLFLGLNSGTNFSAGDLVFFIFNQLVFSVLWGIAAGMAAISLLRMMKVLDAHTLFALSICTPYCTFTVATYYFKDAKSGTGGSGVLSLIPVGLFFNHFMSGLAREEQVHTIHEFWETLSFLATSWLYSLTGLLVGIELASTNVSPIDWASLLGLYMWVFLARFAVVFASLPVFKYAPGGYGFSVREAILLAWGGLRGAVGLLLALIIKGNPSVSKREGQLVQFMMAGLVVLVQIQGITFPLMLKALNVIIHPNARVHDTMRTKMSYRAFFVLTRAGVEPAIAKSILSVQPKQSKKDKSGEDPTTELPITRFSTRKRPSLIKNDPDMLFHELTKEWVSKSVLNDKRRRLLQAQKATYNNLISRELISRAAWMILTRGLDVQLDMDDISMNQWGYLLKTSPRVCCNNIGVHSAEVKALLFALFATDMVNFLAHKEETRLKFMQHSQRSRGRNKLGGILTNPSFTRQESADSKNKGCCHVWFGTEEDDAELGREMRDRDFGIDCEEAQTFGYVSWAYLIAQNQSTELLNEMFKMDDTFTAFEAEQKALTAEIELSKSEPAIYLDTLANHFPDIARKIKSSQVVAEIKDQVYGYVGELSGTGLIEIHAMKKLIRDADKIVRVVKRLDFPLEAPYTVGSNGVDVLKCPNYHPFYHSDMLERFRMDDFEIDDQDLVLQEALDEASITQGFWGKHVKSNQSLGGTSELNGGSPEKFNQVSFSDAPLTQTSKAEGVVGSGEVSPEMTKPLDGGSFGFNLSFNDSQPQRRISGAMEDASVESGKVKEARAGAVKLQVVQDEETDSRWDTVLTPKTPRTSNLVKIQLMRQLSGTNWNAASQEAEGGDKEAEVVAPINPLEYQKLLTSRPAAATRATSFYTKKTL